MQIPMCTLGSSRIQCCVTGQVVCAVLLLAQNLSSKIKKSKNCQTHRPLELWRQGQYGPSERHNPLRQQQRYHPRAWNPQLQQIQNQILYLLYKRCSEIRYTRYLKSRLYRKFFLCKTDVQFSEYIATNLNMLFLSVKEKIFSKCISTNPRYCVIII
jgi:hypothetical protein